jgi:hypothetical protein
VHATPNLHGSTNMPIFIGLWRFRYYKEYL